MKEVLIINANREGYSINQVSGTMTVKELIEFLQQFGDDTEIYIGNDPQYNGWSIKYFYTYGGIGNSDIHYATYNNEDEELFIEG